MTPDIIPKATEVCTEACTFLVSPAPKYLEITTPAPEKIPVNNPTNKKISELVERIAARYYLPTKLPMTSESTVL